LVSDENSGILRAMDVAPAWIKEKSRPTLNPAQVESVLFELGQRWPEGGTALVDLVDRFPLGESALLHLMAVSTICGTRLLQDPQILLWLAEPETILTTRDPAQMVASLQATGGDTLAADSFRALRVWKNREMVRVALREVADAAPLEETTAELSRIAEICIRRVFRHWDAELRQRHGSPSAAFAVLALGKLGGSELNHSSDVDLIFLYSDEGQLSPHFTYHEFFNRLSEKILGTFNSAHPDGALFRLDLRLRPEGTAGPLVRSLRSMEYYYSGYGETWERLALIKARAIAGSAELAYDFLRQHQPFIYPKIATPDLLEQIGNIKHRIEQDLVGADNLHRDVKLGRGGIREIEFVVQTMQFMHGARHAFLQETSTLKALRALAQLELIPRNEVVALDRAYRFLRRTEHRLQIEAEQQTHTIPANPAHLQRVALSLGFGSAAEFTNMLDRQMQAVHEIFQRLVTSSADAKGRDIVSIFADAASAQRDLTELEHGSRGTHVSSRTRQLSRKLRPLLLDALAGIADPDGTLNQFVRFADAYGMRSMLFELLVANPGLLDLLVRTFDASRFAADLLVRHPAWLEEITRGGKLDACIGRDRHLKRLSPAAKDDIDVLRAYRHAELLRIVLRDILGLADQSTTFTEQTELAEACLIFLVRAFDAEDLTIVGLGKLGGSELGYAADLDIVFLGDDPVGAQKLLAASAQPSAEGSLSRLDARLRPEGEKGPLVVSLEAFERYHASRAQFWEVQSLTRARPLCGPLQAEFSSLAQAIWRRAGEDPELTGKIDNMLERIRRDRGSGSEFCDFKTGTGGMIEAEFLIQALQMSTNIWEPNWVRATEKLVEGGHLDDADACDLREAYAFLRRCETVLRRYDNTPVSTLPTDLKEQLMLSRRLGYRARDEFAQTYTESRTAINRIYRARLKRESMHADDFEKLLQDQHAHDQPG
jgi:glutamate-ammonia-ligase adenylyltransferase